MKIENHLIANIDFMSSPNIGPKMKLGLPDTIVIHYTAGASAASSIRSLTNPNSKASAHIVVAKDGTLTQLVPFDTIAWHAGKSSYKDRIGLNQYAIGIEIDNAGPLTKTEDGRYMSWFGKAYPADETLFLTHANEKNPRYWHAYTPEQIEAVFSLCKLLTDTYPIEHILGHEEIAPIRKSDPGPAFPLLKLRSFLFDTRNMEVAADANEKTLGTVTAHLLNIRQSASKNAPIAASPLPKNTKVTILEEQDGFYKIETSISGWVSKDFILKNT